MSNDENRKYWLIDGPSPFAPMKELLAFRKQVLGMLKHYPGHPQWVDELKSVDESIEWRRANPLPGDK